LLSARSSYFYFRSCPAGSPPAAAKEVRVLFVGNSLTFANDLPGLTAGLAKARNINMAYEMHAPGGYTLAQHAGDPRLLKKINKGTWDLVVLQEQSRMPAYPWAQTEVFPHARTLSRLIRAANPRAQIAFYMTMAKKNGDKANPDFPELATYAGLQRKLAAAYGRMSEENQGFIVPVGLAWAKVRAQKPGLGLYADEVHPNLAGTYLAACVFYAVLFKDSPVGLPPPPGLDGETAIYLQTAVRDILAEAPGDQGIK
jgi:hypothetical protein